MYNALRNLKGKKSEYDIIESLSKVCESNPYMSEWKMQPFLLQEACEAFLADWDDETQELLMNRNIEDPQMLSN